MKILILSDGFPPIIGGGAEGVAFDLAKKFYRLGNQVYVITTVRDKSEVRELEQDGLKVWRLYANYHQRWRAYRSIYNPSIVVQVRRIIQQIQPDIVHVHNLHYYLSYYCLKVIRQYDRPVFLTAHDVMSFHYGKLVEFIKVDDLSVPQSFDYRISPLQQIKRFKKRYNPLRNLIIRHYLKYVNQIFAVSCALKEALEQNNIKEVRVIHNGIDLKEWQPDEKQIEEFKKRYNLFSKKVVFFGGRLGGWKGGEELIEAMQNAVQQIPEAVLLVAGQENDYSRKMSQLAKEKGVSMILTGWLEKEELKAAYYCSDLVTTPSLCLDTFNLINLEAMVCQKPVVTTCFGGAPEVVINGETGYIVNPLNIRMMADRIIDLLKDSEKAKQFGQSGYQRAKEEFDLSKQAEKYLTYFKQFIK